jgi:hypothetical protein
MSSHRNVTSSRRRTKRKGAVVGTDPAQLFRHHLEEASVHLRAAEVVATDNGGHNNLGDLSTSTAEAQLRTMQRAVKKLYFRTGGTKHE